VGNGFLQFTEAHHIQQTCLLHANFALVKLKPLNIIHSVHFLFFVYCPTNVHFYSLLIYETQSYMFQCINDQCINCTIVVKIQCNLKY
jgi:hypothetical protein